MINVGGKKKQNKTKTELHHTLERSRTVRQGQVDNDGMLGSGHTMVGYSWDGVGELHIKQEVRGEGSRSIVNCGRQAECTAYVGRSGKSK